METKSYTEGWNQAIDRAIQIAKENTNGNGDVDVLFLEDLLKKEMRE